MFRRISPDLWNKLQQNDQLKFDPPKLRHVYRRPEIMYKVESVWL